MAYDKVRLSSSGVIDLLKSAEVVAMLHAKAEAVAQAARAAAPVKTGNYRAGIVVVDEVHRDRAVSRVVGTAPHSHLVESKSRTLGTAIDSAR